MAVLNLELSQDVDVEEVNNFLRDVSLHSNLRQQISYIASPEVVSSDFVGSTHAGVVDGLATIASGKHLVLYVWYDNEFGYSNQVIRIVEELAGARPQVLPQRLEPSALSALAFSGQSLEGSSSKPQSVYSDWGIFVPSRTPRSVVEKCFQP